MHNDQIVVGIGASAGGLEAINEFFDHMPSDTGMAFVVVQHLSPDFDSLMDALLAKHTKMSIQVVKSETSVRPNHIYLIDKGSNIVIEDNFLKPVQRSKRSQLNLPIDEFFHSLGQNCRKCGIGIILSGTGTDGSRGIRSLKESDGLIFVQSVSSARFDGMPRAAIDTGLVDNILAPKDMAEALVQLSKSIQDGETETLENWTNETDEGLVNEILREILDKRGANFLPYRRTTILRRIEKRMLLNQKHDLKQYVAFVKTNPRELEVLAKEFLIGVTRFFRDQDAFQIVQKTIIPDIFSQKESKEPVRIWVAGCSSGEEAYSLAILAEAYRQEKGISREFKIFASDLDSQAIRSASPGIYPSQIAEDVPPHFLSQYFEKLEDGRYKVIKRIRDSIVFTIHDVLHDPPFINMDLISCRNLLIYLNADMQQQLLHNFRFALNYKGYLFLGPSETLGKLKETFLLVDERWSIFQNLDRNPVHPIHMRRNKMLRPSLALQANQGLEDKLERPMQRLANDHLVKMLLDHYVPTTLLMDASLNLLYVHGNFEELLQFPSSPNLFNLENMTGTEEVLLFKNGIRKVIESSRPHIYKDVPFRKKDRQYKVDLRFEQTADPHRGGQLFLVEFLRTSKNDTQAENVVVSKETDLYEEQIRTMEMELRRLTDERMQLVERLEATNEELQSSNEELIAANEELQSTNEELQSVNEELYTVNAELQANVSELTLINSDMDNLFRSTEIGTIFVDRRLRIRKFTPAIANLFQLQDSDLGRPITAFVSLLKDVDFQKKIEWVLKHNQFIEEEVNDHHGRPFLMRLMPYLLDSQVDGVVATFVDIQQLKDTSKKLKIMADQYTALFDNSDHIITVLKPDGSILDINHAPDGYDRKSLIGSEVWRYLSEEDVQPSKDAFNAAIEYGKVINCSLRLNTPTGITRFYSNYLVPIVEDGKVNRVLSVSKDETKLREIEQDTRLKAAIFNNVFQFAREHIVIMSPEGKILDVNFTDAGFKKTNILGKYIFEIQAKRREGVKAELAKIQNGAHFTTYESQLVDADGKQRWYHNILSAVNHNGHLERIILITRDITDSKLMEISLKRSNQDLEARISEHDTALKRKNIELKNINSFLDSFVHGAAHDLRSPLLNIKGYVDLLPDVEDEEEMKTIFEELKAASNRMERVLNGLVELIEFQRKDGPKPKEINLQQLIHRTLDDLKPQLDEVGGEVTVELPEGLTINYIEAYLQSMVYNLLHNAIKYRSDNRPLKVNVKANVEEDSSVRLSVQDNGIGMDLQRYGHFLFKPFRRLTVEREGTGIGLSIINNAVKKNGGRIEVKSELEKGSAFHVYINPYN